MGKILGIFPGWVMIWYPTRENRRFKRAAAIEHFNLVSALAIDPNDRERKPDKDILVKWRRAHDEKTRYKNPVKNRRNIWKKCGILLCWGQDLNKYEGWKGRWPGNCILLEKIYIGRVKEEMCCLFHYGEISSEMYIDSRTPCSSSMMQTLCKLNSYPIWYTHTFQSTITSDSMSRFNNHRIFLQMHIIHIDRNIMNSHHFWYTWTIASNLHEITSIV